jgi:hypothetical protein
MGRRCRATHAASPLRRECHGGRVLVIREQDSTEDAWALTYGMGFQLLRWLVRRRP